MDTVGLPNHGRSFREFFVMSPKHIGVTALACVVALVVYDKWIKGRV